MSEPTPASVPRTRFEDGQRALRRRLGISCALMLGTGALGTLGYWLLWRGEGGSFFDAVYMTVITMTTIGFEEVRPLGVAGRLLTMGIALVGIGSLFFLLSAVMEYLVSQPWELRRRHMLNKEIAGLKDHVVIAGLGRVGRQAADELALSGLSFVVADPAPAALEFAAARGFLLVAGDCTLDETLDRVGIERASGLIVTTDSDATNMYVVISARLKNPRLHIASRAVDEASIPKLIRAGANKAISPYAIGGRRLAHLISNPNAVEFFETALGRADRSVTVEEIAVEAPLAGRTVGGVRESSGAAVLALFRGPTPLPNPDAAEVLAEGDRMLVMGTDEQLRRLGVGRR